MHAPQSRRHPLARRHPLRYIWVRIVVEYHRHHRERRIIDREAIPNREGRDLMQQNNNYLYRIPVTPQRRWLWKKLLLPHEMLAHTHFLCLYGAEKSRRDDPQALPCFQSSYGSSPHTQKLSLSLSVCMDEFRKFHAIFILSLAWLAHFSLKCTQNSFRSSGFAQL